MTPGEVTIYDYIVERNAYYACLNIQVEVTRRILDAYAANEWQRMKELEPKIWKYILKEFGSFPLADRYGRSSLFCSIFNDIANGVQYENHSQGHWDIYPLNGKCIPIPYSMFDRDLGISKDVAKSCLERLIDREKITRKRVMGGFQYSPSVIDIKKKMTECPGEWKPRHFNPGSMEYEEDKNMWPVIEAAQKELEPFQEYYERMVRDS